MPTKFWNLFHLKPYPLERWPEWMRAWITITVMVACCSLLVGLMITSILLMRLSWDALFSPASHYQEATRNFLLAFASAFGAPFLVWRTWVAHQQAKAAAEQARVALENHVTGIFSKSVELMGLVRETRAPRPDGTTATNSAPNIEARLGAIYSLERLLRESEKDQRAILETLCAYVRENSPLEIPTDEAEASIFHRGELPPAPTRRGDVQAAITVIGRRTESVRARAVTEGWRLDFRGTNLIAYAFSGLNYDRSDFSDSFLNAADMNDASFVNCTFKHCFLRAVKMKGARFDASIFDDCDVSQAEIEQTGFRSAKLIDTDLRKANVKSFGIQGANLDEAFNSHLAYVVESVKKEKPNAYNVREIMSIYELLQKANFDKETSVSQAVQDVMLIMNENSRTS